MNKYHVFTLDHGIKSILSESKFSDGIIIHFQTKPGAVVENVTLRPSTGNRTRDPVNVMQYSDN